MGTVTKSSALAPLISLLFLLVIACGAEAAPAATLPPAATPTEVAVPTATPPPVPKPTAPATPAAATEPAPTPLAKDTSEGATSPSANTRVSDLGPATGSTGIADLIPRDTLFTLPDSADLQLSPDGEHISYRAPVCSLYGCFMNVWVAPVDDPDAAKPVTEDTTHGIQGYFWAFTNNHILYTQDTEGDENWRIYSVDFVYLRGLPLTM